MEVLHRRKADEAAASSISNAVSGAAPIPSVKLSAFPPIPQVVRGALAAVSTLRIEVGPTSKDQPAASGVGAGMLRFENTGLALVPRGRDRQEAVRESRTHEGLLSVAPERA
jgi:hypothetical protein